MAAAGGTVARPAAGGAAQAASRGRGAAGAAAGGEVGGRRRWTRPQTAGGRGPGGERARPRPGRARAARRTRPQAAGWTRARRRGRRRAGSPGPRRGRRRDRRPGTRGRPPSRSACASRPSMLERRSPGNTDHHPAAWHPVSRPSPSSSPGASGASGALPLLTDNNTVSPGSAWPWGFCPTTVPRSALLSVVSTEVVRPARCRIARASLTDLPDDVGDLRDRGAVEVARVRRRQRQHRLARPAAVSSPRTTSARASSRRRCCRCRTRTATRSRHTAGGARWSRRT